MEKAMWTHYASPLLGILSAFLFFLGTIDEAEDPNMEGEERLWVSRNPHRKNDKSLRALVLLAMKSTFPVSLWSGPFKSLLDCRSRPVNPVRLLNSDGIIPVSEFEERDSSRNCVRLPSSGGIHPVNRFEERHRLRSWVRLPNHRGMLPVSWFIPAKKLVQAMSCRHSSGMWPESLLRWMRSVCNAVRLPISRGMLPVNSLAWR